jgi:hypothetical protein
MTTYTINELYDKRAEIAGQIVQAEKKVRDLRADLAHVEAAIRILRPGTVLEKVVPRHVEYRPRYFKRGQLMRLIVNHMREHAGEIVVIADIVPIAVGNRALSAHERDRLGVTIYQALGRLADRGIVTRAGSGARQSRWTMAKEASEA